jgi:hypothetical protein
MIDWTKPIETMDRRRVKRVADLACAGTVIYVYPVSPDNRGDSFIVNHEGYRCDDRALYSARQEPFIRNVKVKREGWVNIYAVYKTEDEAKRACADLNGNCHRFVKWEE